VSAPRCDSNIDVVAAARNGDQDGWAELYRGVYRRLRAYVARRVPAEQVEDLIAETFTCAVRGIDRYAGGSERFDEWVFALARRLVPSGAPLEQDVIELRAIGGFTVEPVARILGRRPGVVRAAEAQAYERLHQEEEVRAPDGRPLDSRREVELLDTLMAALQPPVAEPSAASLFRLRTDVAQQFR